MPARKYSEEQIEAVLEMRERGLSYGQIEMKTGVNQATVYSHCLRLGAEPPEPAKLRSVPTAPTSYTRNGKTVRLFTEQEDRQVMRMAIDGVSSRQIAAKLDRLPHVIRGRIAAIERRIEREG